MGLVILLEQLGELKLGELHDAPPLRLDEAIAFSKVMQFLESPQYNMFTRIVLTLHQRDIHCDFCHCRTSSMHQ